ncbi:MAG: hypothetical protein E2O40_06660 [Planctomycetota bacterium]|nr:MAG: hypothetical protein E2O40_06660 [Planctomycetota bacterium]
MTDLQTTAHSDLLIKLLERQQALAEQLTGVAEKQTALIEAGDSDGLLAVLTHRQRIMDQFTAGQDSLARLTDAAHRDEPAVPGVRDRIGILIEDISDRLTEIMRVDETDRTALDAGRDRIGEALSDLTTAREARQAYLSAVSVTNRFADRRG